MKNFWHIPNQAVLLFWFSPSMFKELLGWLDSLAYAVGNHFGELQVAGCQLLKLNIKHI
jgi:hypothetical protein